MKPLNILEFGLGQSSKMIHQYAEFYKNVHAVTCEHDQTWMNFFMNHMEGDYKINKKLLELQEIEYNNQKTLSYKDIENEFKDQRFDLIVVDAPYGADRYSRSQIITLLPLCLQNTFCILFDDSNRFGESESVKEILSILKLNNIPICHTNYFGMKEHTLICSENLKFLTSM
jgi:hypothetical protein